MLNLNQFRSFIIEPALYDLKLLSNEAIELLIFTCAVESQGGTFIKQVKGPALGIYQMEPKTYNDLWTNYLASQLTMRLQLIHNFGCNNIPDEERLVYDLRYATAMTRIHYSRFKQPLPNANDLMAIWTYYKTYYNTSNGAAEYEEAINLYKKFKS